MESHQTRLGRIEIGERNELFRRLVELLHEAASGPAANIGVGPSGGGTPQSWFRWVAQHGALVPKDLRNVIWTVSDERHVPVEHPDSNFGNVLRLMLGPLGFREDKCFPWPVGFEPGAAAVAFASQWATRFGPDFSFDLCLLGLGEDCHTASIFPHSPLFKREKPTLFAAVEGPDKGWRLTVTPSGLEKAGRINVLVTGASKRDPLAAALLEDIDEPARPVQLLSRVAPRTTLLCDPAAAAGLPF